VSSPLSDGSPSAPVLIVGQAPTREDLAEGRPFVSPYGRLLWSAVKAAGFTREQCLCVNVIGEWPEGAGGEASKGQVAAWWDRFDEVIKASRAKVALCLGGVAFDRLTGIFECERLVRRRSGIENWRGYLVQSSECGARYRTVEKEGLYKSSGKNKAGIAHKKGDPRVIKVKVKVDPVLPEGLEWIIPTLDPAGVMRTGLKTLPAFRADIERAGRALRGELRLKSVEFSEEPFLLGGGRVVADIETPANPYESGIILRVGAASPEGAWSARWDSRSREMLKDLMDETSTLKILHNHSFDRPRLEAYDVPVKGKVRDTMLMAALEQPDLYKGLNSVASLYLDGPKWKHLSEENPALYNAWDCVKTLEVHDALEDKLTRHGQIKLLDSTIMPGSEVLMRMSERGIKMDEEAREKWVGELREKVSRAEDAWTQATGVSPRATLKVREWLDKRAVPRLDSAYSKYGGVTTDASALRDVLKWCLDQPEGRYDEVHRAVNSLLTYREHSKLLSTYTAYPLDDSCCVHPSYLPGAKDDDNEVTGKGLAGTWRITSRDPNFQNIPQEAKHMFVPHHPELTFLEADFAQIELRIAAELSHDGVLQTALAQTDVFRDLTEFLGVDRTRAKNAMYGSLYGAGPRTLVKVFRAQAYTITEAECKDLQRGISTRYPKLWAWRERVKEQGQAQFYLVNPYGLRRWFYNRNDVPAMIDFMPQSTAAIIMWQTLAELAGRLEEVGGWIVNTIHDSVLCEVPKGAKLLRAESIVRDVMEKPREELGGLRVPVKVKTGENWGEMK
jgi:uracil-DNA glycosylase family 4